MRLSILILFFTLMLAISSIVVKAGNETVTNARRAAACAQSAGEATSAYLARLAVTQGVATPPSTACPKSLSRP